MFVHCGIGEIISAEDLASYFLNYFTIVVSYCEMSIYSYNSSPSHTITACSLFQSELLLLLLKYSFCAFIYSTNTDLLLVRILRREITLLNETDVLSSQFSDNKQESIWG
jgi:hypothetical protein